MSVYLRVYFIKQGLEINASTAHSIFAVSGRLRMFEGQVGAEKGHWKGFSPHSVHRRGTLDGTLSCFVHWMQTRGHCNMLFTMEGCFRGHFISLCPLEGHFRGHFIMFYLLQGHPQGALLHGGAEGIDQWLQCKNRLGGKLVVHSKVYYSCITSHVKLELHQLKRQIYFQDVLKLYAHVFTASALMLVYLLH